MVSDLIHCQVVMLDHPKMPYPANFMSKGIAERVKMSVRMQYYCSDYFMQSSSFVMQSSLVIKKTMHPSSLVDYLSDSSVPLIC